MERLTTYRKDGRAAIANKDGASPLEQTMKIPAVIDRLAAYEDTGLEPEECAELAHLTVLYDKAGLDAKDVDWLIKMVAAVQNLPSVERMHDLLEADKDGRLLVLPCKVKTLVERYNVLKFPTGDEAENYSTGYRNGHKNGHAELLEYLLGIDTGERSEAAEAALKAGEPQ